MGGEQSASVAATRPERSWVKAYVSSGAGFLMQIGEVVMTLLHPVTH